MDEKRYYSSLKEQISIVKERERKRVIYMVTDVLILLLTFSFLRLIWSVAPQARSFVFCLHMVHFWGMYVLFRVYWIYTKRDVRLTQEYLDFTELWVGRMVGMIIPNGFACFYILIDLFVHVRKLT